ncbi:MAG: nicotinate (nicotinamide) nucleotide adenylyltransferase [Ruminococcaceae bacterium]|nr:nicotinate (nicotinamide) nucleotide adenylyltransferase [Oscillospiraceae bacterium]
MSQNKKKRRTGLFGGTFAPPHLGHLHAAETFLSEMALDELIIMPTFIPPHKEHSAGDTPELRFRMCRSMFGALPRTVVSDYEIRREGVSYTVNTLEHLMEEDPEREIFLLCGTDMLLTLDTWRRAADIFSLCEIVCMPRYDGSLKEVIRKADGYSERFGKKVTILSEDPFVLSSTEVREKIRQRSDLSEFLSQDVIEIIKNEGLYL